VRKAILAHKKMHGKDSREAAYKMLSEEMGELLTAMNHHRRKRAKKQKVCEEIADVMLLLRLLAHELGREYLVEAIMKEKAERFGKRALGLEGNHEDPEED
jgi:NTP pyrophosphatase (non-canonical NTP hydrolase)